MSNIHVLHRAVVGVVFSQLLCFSCVDSSEAAANGGTRDGGVATRATQSRDAGSSGARGPGESRQLPAANTHTDAGEPDASVSTPSTNTELDAAVSGSRGGTAAAGPSKCTTKTTAAHAGGDAFDAANAIAVHRDGSAYVVGSFQGTAQFGPISLTALGMKDGFVAKYDAQGSIVWAQRLGGASFDRAQAAAVLEDGSVYVAGVLDQTVDFDRLPMLASGQSLFLAKLSADGALAWMHTARPTRDDDTAGPANAYGIAAVADGSVYLTGEYKGTWSFADTVLAANGDYDIFLAKYAPDGTLTWAQRAGGSGWDTGRGVAALPDGSVYVTGQFRSSAQFGTTQLDDPTGLGDDKLFLAKYAPDGTLRWVKATRGGSVAGNSVATHSDGSAFVTGTLGGTVTFDDDGHSVLDSVGPNLFVAKYTHDGKFVWGRGAIPAAGGESAGRAVAALDDGSTYVTGESLGDVKLGSTTLSSVNGWQMLLTKLAADGSVVWTRQADTSTQSGYSLGSAVAARDHCTAYVTGTFSRVWSFEQTVFSAPQGTDVFLLRFAD